MDDTTIIINIITSFICTLVCEKQRIQVRFYIQEKAAINCTYVVT